MRIVKNYCVLFVLFTTLRVSFADASLKDCGTNSIRNCVNGAVKFSDNHPWMRTMCLTLAPQVLRYTRNQPQNYFLPITIAGGVSSFVAYCYSNRPTCTIKQKHNQEATGRVQKPSWCTDLATHMAISALASYATHATAVNLYKKHPYLLSLGAMGVGIGYYYTRDPHSHDDSRSASKLTRRNSDLREQGQHSIYDRFESENQAMTHTNGINDWGPGHGVVRLKRSKGQPPQPPSQCITGCECTVCRKKKMVETESFDGDDGRSDRHSDAPTAVQRGQSNAYPDLNINNDGTATRLNQRKLTPPPGDQDENRDGLNSPRMPPQDGNDPAWLGHGGSGSLGDFGVAGVTVEEDEEQLSDDTLIDMRNDGMVSDLSRKDQERRFFLREERDIANSKKEREKKRLREFRNYEQEMRKQAGVTEEVSAADFGADVSVWALSKRDFLKLWEEKENAFRGRQLGEANVRREIISREQNGLFLHKSREEQERDRVKEHTDTGFSILTVPAEQSQDNSKTSQEALHPTRSFVPGLLMFLKNRIFKQSTPTGEPGTQSITTATAENFNELTNIDDLSEAEYNKLTPNQQEKFTAQQRKDARDRNWGTSTTRIEETYQTIFKHAKTVHIDPETDINKLSAQELNSLTLSQIASFTPQQLEAYRAISKVD